MTRPVPVLGAVLAIALAATGALAHQPPAADPSRPGPYAFELPAAVETLDPVPNGFVNRSSGVLAALVNQDAGPYTGGPEQAARAYLAERAGDFGLSLRGEDLLLDRVQESPAGFHVRMRQSLAGVPVWRADLVVSLDREGRRVRAAYSGYDPILAHAGVAATTPSIDAAEARSAALGRLGVSGEPAWMGTPSEALWIVREQDLVGSPGRLAWRVVLPIQEPAGDWEAFVDARDGSILRLADRTVLVDGQGYAFDPDPLTTAEVPYGGQYADNNDGDTVELNNERVLKTLRDLTFQAGVYKLTGPYVQIIEWDPPNVPPVTQVDPNAFTYTRSPSGFEDVNVYAHLDANQRYIQSLGFNDIQNGSIGADSHGWNGQDNSSYTPSTNRLSFGEGGVDDAEDADVVLHEYGHAIQHSIVSNWGGGQEGAMGEGFGDFWAGSYSASISLYRWEWVFNWDGHNNFWAGRVLNTSLTYPGGLNGQVHHDGQIWSAPWMQIWFQCGRTVTDTDILQHHYYMSGSATMAQAAAFAMQADKDLYAGLHSGSLDNYFTARGFFTAAQYDVPALTHTPLGDQNVAGPYPLTVTIQSTSAIVAGSVKVKFGTGAAFDQEAVLDPTGNPNEWGGAIPGQGGDVDIRYYLIADNVAGWRGANPLGAEFAYHQFHVGPLTGVDEVGGAAAFALSPAVPNPFGPSTTLRFSLPQRETVRVVVHDLTGRVVRTLVAGELAAGTYTTSWDGLDDDGHAAAAGIYFSRLSSASGTLTRKIVLAR